MVWKPRKSNLNNKTFIKKDSLLAFSTFTPENFKEIKEISGLTLQYKQKDEILNILTSQGFEILYCEEFYEEITFKTPLELLAHMKKQE